MNPNTFRLTDELERQLMLQAMEDQFRPRPMRALAAGPAQAAEWAAFEPLLPATDLMPSASLRRPRAQDSKDF